MSTGHSSSPHPSPGPQQMMGHHNNHHHHPHHAAMQPGMSMTLGGHINHNTASTPFKVEASNGRCILVYVKKRRNCTVPLMINISLSYVRSVLARRWLYRRRDNTRCEPPKTVAPPLTDQTTAINNLCWVLNYSFGLYKWRHQGDFEISTPVWNYGKIT